MAGFYNGKKPQNLPGAKNNLIKITYQDGYSPKAIKVGKFTPSKQQVLDERIYSGKAIDFMNEKKITPAEVEKAISEGDLNPQGEYKFYFHEDNTGFFWVQVNPEDKVVLVAR